MPRQPLAAHDGVAVIVHAGAHAIEAAGIPRHAGIAPADALPGGQRLRLSTVDGDAERPQVVVVAARHQVVDVHERLRGARILVEALKWGTALVS